MRVHRLIAILLLVESRGKIKAKELAEKFEISERTVYRDIDALCEAGIPIFTSTGPDGGISLMDDYKVGIDNISEEDIVHLHLFGKGLKPDYSSDLSLKINNTIMKLQKRLSSKQKDKISTINKRFHIDGKPWWGSSFNSKMINNILSAVFESRKLNIIYKKITDEVSGRLVLPYGIVVKEDEWYMVAYCTERCAIRTFKCERIVDNELLDEEFDIPQDFSLTAYWNSSKKSFKKLCKERLYPVVLKVENDLEYTIGDLDALDIKYCEGYAEVTVNMVNLNYAKENISQIIRYEVTSPKKVREYAKDEIKRLNDLYYLNNV